MNQEDVARALQKVYDPELGIDIVSLGLLYGIEVEPEALTVTMTTTTKSCPMSGAIANAVGQTLEANFPDRRITVLMADGPPWDTGMMTPPAREWLGIR